MKRILVILLVAISMTALAAAEPGSLRITYNGKNTELTLVDFAKLRQTEVDAPDHERNHRFKGVAVRDLLSLVGAPLGEDLRRPTLSLAVRVTGADGYVCAFALAEFDEGFSQRTIMIATHLDGAPLPAELGPWRLITPNDRRLARWVRQVVALEVISLASDPAGTNASERKKFVPR